MKKEEREMVCELLNWIAESGEETASTTPMTDRAAHLFGLYRLDYTWHLRPDDSCSWHDPFYGAGT
jgi:hypothetical protein